MPATNLQFVSFVCPTLRPNRRHSLVVQKVTEIRNTYHNLSWLMMLNKEHSRNYALKTRPQGQLAPKRGQAGSWFQQLKLTPQMRCNLHPRLPESRVQSPDSRLQTPESGWLGGIVVGPVSES